MSNEPDILISDKSGQLIAIVEVKDRQQINQYMAAEFHERFRKYSSVGSAKFFLLVTRDRVSFWQTDIPIKQGLAVLDFKTEPIFEFYKNIMDPKAKGTLDFLVFKWLADMTNGIGPGPSNYSSKEFENFRKAILGAQVRFGAR